MGPKKCFKLSKHSLRNSGSNSSYKELHFDIGFVVAGCGLYSCSIIYLIYDWIYFEFLHKILEDFTFLYINNMMRHRLVSKLVCFNHRLFIIRYNRFLKGSKINWDIFGLVFKLNSSIRQMSLLSFSMKCTIFFYHENTANLNLANLWKGGSTFS